MIKVDSLRVGNKITDNFDRILTVHEIKQSGIRCLYKGEQNTEFYGIRNSLFGFTDIYGISLTEDVIKSCGFELITWNGAVRQYFTEIKKCTALSFTFGQYRDNPDRLDKVTIGTMPDLSGSTYGNFDINSLHQLQNLYFSLTGTELSIDI